MCEDVQIICTLGVPLFSVILIDVRIIPRPDHCRRFVSQYWQSEDSRTSPSLFCIIEKLRGTKGQQTVNRGVTFATIIVQICTLFVT